MHSWIVARSLIIIVEIMDRICRRQSRKSRSCVTSLILLLFSVSSDVETSPVETKNYNVE